MTTIFDAYRGGAPEVMNRFAAAPDSLLQKKPETNLWAQDVAAAVNDFQRELGTTKRVLTGNEAVVVTGQQPGLFTGPMYTIHKAITAIQAAAALEQHGTPCVPLFWTASDDHDYEEVRTAHFLTKRDDLLTLRCGESERGNRPNDIPMHAMPLSPETHRLIDAVASACRTSSASAEIVDFLHDSLDKADSLSTWFSRIMARLFRDTSLRLFEPRLREARIASASVMKREVESPLESTRLLIESGKELQALGFQPPIQRNDNVANFFIEEHGRRRRVLFNNNRYFISGNERGYSIQEMLSLLAASPENFSPNVALRPVVQQALFNPVAYVAGPGEIAYWAQLKPLFTFFELPMPVVYPRIQAVVTTDKINRLLASWHLELEALSGDHNLLTEVLKNAPKDSHFTAFQEKAPQVELALSEFASSVLGDNPPAKVQKAVKAYLSHTHFRLDKLQSALIFSDQEKRKITEARLARARNLIVPLRKPQERILSVFSFLFRDGWPLIERMLEELDWTKRELQELEW